MKINNYKGFTGVEALLIILIVAIVGATGYYVYSSRSKTESAQPTSTQSPSGSTSTTYDSDKVKYIKNFDLASDSFKLALVGSLFDEAKAQCEEASDVNDGTYVKVGKMVRDDFATAQYCGSGATSVFAKVSGEWKAVASLGMAPTCKIVDQYEISKEAVSHCYEEGATEARPVTYP